MLLPSVPSRCVNAPSQPTLNILLRSRTALALLVRKCTAPAPRFPYGSSLDSTCPSDRAHVAPLLRKAFSERRPLFQPASRRSRTRGANHAASEITEALDEIRTPCHLAGSRPRQKPLERPHLPIVQRQLSSQPLLRLPFRLLQGATEPDIAICQLSPQ